MYVNVRRLACWINMDKPIYTILGPQRYQISIHVGSLELTSQSNSTSPSRADSTQLGSSDRDTKNHLGVSGGKRKQAPVRLPTVTWSHFHHSPPEVTIPDFSFEKGMIFSTRA